MARRNRYSNGMGMGYGYMEANVMNDRGGYMLGKVFLVMALIMTAMGGALAWQWAKHEAVEAQAEYQRVLNAQLQAQLEAQIPYMDAIEAEKARQLIARMQSEGLTAEVMAEVQRRQLLHDQDMKEAADAETLAFQRSLHGVVASLALTLGLAVILIPSALITFVLFKKVGTSLDAQAEALAQAREAMSALPPPQRRTPQPVAPQPVAPQPVAPQPVAPRVAPVTGRLPGLPQGQPRREQPQPAVARPQPAVAQPQPQPQPVAGPAVLDRSAMHSFGPGPANGHVASHNGNGIHPSRNGRGPSSNGVNGNH